MIVFRSWSMTSLGLLIPAFYQIGCAATTSVRAGFAAVDPTPQVRGIEPDDSFTKPDAWEFAVFCHRPNGILVNSQHGRGLATANQAAGHGRFDQWRRGPLAEPSGFRSCNHLSSPLNWNVDQ
jgi:hypothetical protein